MLGTMKSQLHPISTMPLSFLSYATKNISVFTMNGEMTPTQPGLRASKGLVTGAIKLLPMNLVTLFNML